MVCTIKYLPNDIVVGCSILDSFMYGRDQNVRLILALRGYHMVRKIPFFVVLFCTYRTKNVYGNPAFIETINEIVAPVRRMAFMHMGSSLC